jgi:signal transduction histidine kinase
MVLTGFGDVIAERMRAEHTALAARWFERLSALLPVPQTEVFPSSSLLDHIPALIVEISGYLRSPDEEPIAANAAVIEKARSLGALRHAQRASLHQVLREYQLLGRVLVAFVQEEIQRRNLSPAPSETVTVISRLHQAVDVLMQATVETFVGLYNQTIADQAARLEQFTRMATHEWRQPLGSLQFAVSLLRQSDMNGERERRTLDVMTRNLDHLIEMTRKIEAVARIHGGHDDPAVQEVNAGTIAAEAARQLREMAEVRGVDLRVADEMPTLTIDVGRLELVLVNLLSNGIKYADPAKPVRVVEVLPGTGSGRCCRIVVRDNGIGIPRDRLATIFDQFSRAHPDQDAALNVTGIGLGLAIVADCVHALKGRIDVESRETAGTTFVLTLPITPGGARPSCETP